MYICVCPLCVCVVCVHACVCVCVRVRACVRALLSAKLNYCITRKVDMELIGINVDSWMLHHQSQTYCYVLLLSRQIIAHYQMLILQPI